MSGQVLKQKEEYTVGWICPLNVETVAAIKMLDVRHKALPNEERDKNMYYYGSVGDHNVVIATLADEMGNSLAATVASQMWDHFPSLKFALLVGIGGGVPSSADIQLGDVVVSKPVGEFGGVVQYDKGKETVGDFVRKGTLDKPPAELLRALGSLSVREDLGESTFLENLTAHSAKYQYPESAPDNLYATDYPHEGGPTCDNCRQDKIVRKSPKRKIPRIYTGTIASGDKVMKNGAERDKISEGLKGVLCFEMEAAGLLTSLPCLVVRGISDYSDSHKNDGWRHYAAATAAACAKEILQVLPRHEIHGMKSITETIQKVIRDENKEKEAQKDRRRIASWLIPDSDFTESSHDTKSLFGDGTWFQELDTIRSWLESDATAEARCFGAAGVGKTVLSDQIRRKTYRSLNSSEALVLSIYLDYDSRRRQTVEHCLRHLLRQIVSHSSVPPIGEVKRQHDITMSTGEQPTLGDLTNLLKSVLTHFQTVYIIVDGLEEVDKNIAAELQYELVQVRKDVKAVKIRLAFFSRNEPAERTRGMGRFCDTGSGHRGPLERYWTCRVRNEEHQYDLCCECYDEGLRCPDHASQDSMCLETLQEISTPDEVIMSFVADELKKALSGAGAAAWESLFQTQPALRKRIPEIIAAKAKGSFLVARKCMDFLNSVDTPYQVFNTLKSLPSTLTDTYDELMKRIDSLRTGERQLAERALTWIAISERPLSVNELGEALSLDYADSDFCNVLRRPLDGSVSAKTYGLVNLSYDMGTSENRHTIHLTFRDYLKRQDGDHWFRKWRTMIAREVMKFMNLRDFRIPCKGKVQASLKSRFERHPFYRYAAVHWPEHVRPHQSGENGDEDVKRELLEFLGDHRRIESWLQAASNEDDGNLEELFGKPQALALHICAGYGFDSVIASLNSAQQDIDAGDPFFHRPPLVYACRSGHTDTALALIEAGASANVEDNEGYTPLIAAILQNEDVVVKALLKKHPDVDVNKRLPGLSHRPPLILAVASHPQRSSEKGVPVQPDSEAVERSETIMKELLKHPNIQVNLTDQDGRSALKLAVTENKEALVDLLLDCRGLDLGQVGDDGETCLITAARFGRLSLVTRLLDEGANPNVGDTKANATFLQHAVDEGHGDIVAAVLEREDAVNFQARDRQGRTLLHAASINKRDTIVELLLESEAGIDVNTAGDKGETPLHDACRDGSRRVAQVLLSHGAGLDIRDKQEQSPQDLARLYGNFALLAFLDKVPRDASLERLRDTLEKMTLEPASEDEAAAQDQAPHLEDLPDLSDLPVWSLAKLGALATLEALPPHRLTTASTDFYTDLGPVHMAVAYDQPSTLSFLLSAGLPAHTSNLDGRTALHIAAVDDNPVCAALLLEHDCGLNAKDVTGRTALHAAVFHCAWTTALLLIQADAEIADDDAWLKQEALVIAVSSGDARATRIACAKGANPWALDENAHSPRTIARMNGDAEVFDVLDDFSEAAAMATAMATAAAAAGQTGGGARGHGFHDKALGAFPGVAGYLRGSFAAVPSLAGDVSGGVRDVVVVVVQEEEEEEVVEEVD